MSFESNAVCRILTDNGGPAFHNMAAGTGWFVEGEQEGTMLTNAHVVKEARAIVINLPCNHTLDIPAYVAGISTDLDLAVLKLSPKSLEIVKNNLYMKFKNKNIPTLRMGNSDSIKMGDHLNARGYPLAVEYLQMTRGVFSGWKHANEQVYIAHTSTINPGNSGGPLFSENGHVIGINTMKMQNAEEVNMSIPSNRIKRVLPELLNNSENMKQIQEWLILARAAYGTQTPSNHEVNDIGDMMRQVSVKLDAFELLKRWDTNALGGYKKVRGEISKVSFEDFYKKHVHGKENKEDVFCKVVESISKEQYHEVHNMRKDGFSNFKPKHCAAKISSQKATQRVMNVINVPPRVLHMPRLAYKFSNSSGAATLSYLNVPSAIKTGIIVSDVVRGGMMHKAGLKVKDFIHKCSINNSIYDIDNYGESWFSNLSVSLPLIDIIHRCNFGDNITFHIIRDGKEKELNMKYNFLTQEDKPEIRSLDSLKDMPLSKQFINIKGIAFKPLRLNDVVAFKLAKYLNPHRQNDFKVVVMDLAFGTPAFHSKNLVPGDVLTKVNDEPVANSWNGFLEQLSKIGNQEAAFESERGEILIV